MYHWQHIFVQGKLITLVRVWANIGSPSKTWSTRNRNVTDVSKECKIHVMHFWQWHYRIHFNPTVVDCGSLSNLTNGQVSHTAGTTFGQTANYTCDAGYSLVGGTTRTCQTTGTWSGSAPTCQGMLLLPCVCVCAQLGKHLDLSYSQKGTTCITQEAHYIKDFRQAAALLTIAVEQTFYPS